MSQKQVGGIGNLIGYLGNSIQEFPLGERRWNLEIAIVCYKILLDVFPKDRSPEKWAATQNNLAIAYRKRIEGDTAQNIDQGIAAYNLALTVYDRAAFPELWGAVKTNLSAAYRERIRGERRDNIEKSIAMAREALMV